MKKKIVRMMALKKMYSDALFVSFNLKMIFMIPSKLIFQIPLGNSIYFIPTYFNSGANAIHSNRSMSSSVSRNLLHRIESRKSSAEKIDSREANGRN